MTADFKTCWFRYSFLSNYVPAECDDNICVVGVFGKSHRPKGLMLNGVINGNTFQHIQGHNSPSEKSTDIESCYIECFYDAEQKVLYLHLVSSYDTAILSRLCRQMPPNLSNADCHTFWKDHSTSHARALLFMFSVCHIMMVVHPKNTFDTSYLQLFRALQSLREKLIPTVTNLLKETPASKELKNNGRLCTPRLLFICQQTDMTEDELDSNITVSSLKSKYKRWSPRKLLKHSLEDQIYRLLRKSRILTNNLSHCLFTVPGNQAFVYFLDQQCLATDPVELLISEMNKNFPAFRKDSKLQQALAVTTPAPSTQFKIFTDSIPSVEEVSCSNDLRSFLWEHIGMVLTGKGFDDGVGRGPSTSQLEPLSFSRWQEVANKLYDFFMAESSEPKVIGHFNAMTSALDLDMRFSEARCNKVLPIATRTYQEGAPSHYTSTVHASRLAQAMKVFSQHARGPAFEKYANQLQAECQLFWQSGRQLCEVVSFTGHHCIHKLHLLPDSVSDPEREAVIPRMPHTNNNRTPCACNCGRTVEQRDDPFTLKLANYNFFHGLEDRCCSKLKHHQFLLYEPKRRDSKILRAMATQDQPKDGGKEATAGKSELHKEEGQGKMMSEKLKNDSAASIPNTFSPALSLGQSGDMLSHEAHSGLPGNSGTASLLSMGDGAHDTVREKRQYLRETSTAEYLQGMMCSTSPRSLLPLFSSWSLLCLGKASLYNPSKGLEQPGFLRDSNFLLPWDIPIPKGSALDPSWPILSESSSGGGRKGGKHRDKRGQKDTNSDPSIRAYIGNEYECPRGHRFICSGPDKIVKATSSGIVKDTGTKLVTSDMPLYHPCPCRTTKPPLGQLLRAFVVTPDVPLYIKLNPRLRPGPHPCPIFHPEVTEDGITLSGNSLWVLRFPYVYVDENGPILPPTDNQPPPSAKLLRGMYLTTAQKPPDT